MPLTLVHEARTRDVLVKRRTTVRQMLIVFTPACYQHSGPGGEDARNQHPIPRWTPSGTSGKSCVTMDSTWVMLSVRQLIMEARQTSAHAARALCSRPPEASKADRAANPNAYALASGLLKIPDAFLAAKVHRAYVEYTSTISASGETNWNLTISLVCLSTN